MAKRDFLRLPVVSASAEFLVMGYLMRRNILAYKAPPNNEGYDLICIHPDPATNRRATNRRRSRSRVGTPRFATEGRSEPHPSATCPTKLQTDQRPKGTAHVLP
jgi:hypothetical protein